MGCTTHPSSIPTKQSFSLIFRGTNVYFKNLRDWPTECLDKVFQNYQMQI